MTKDEKLKQIITRLNYIYEFHDYGIEQYDTIITMLISMIDSGIDNLPNIFGSDDSLILEYFDFDCDVHIISCEWILMDDGSDDLFLERIKLNESTMEMIQSNIKKQFK